MLVLLRIDMSNTYKSRHASRQKKKVKPPDKKMLLVAKKHYVWLYSVNCTLTLLMTPLVPQNDSFHGDNSPFVAHSLTTQMSRNEQQYDCASDNTILLHTTKLMCLFSWPASTSEVKLYLEWMLVKKSVNTVATESVKENCCFVFQQSGHSPSS